MSDDDDSHDCDVLVAGSGAAGLTAAVTAAAHGLKVVVAEKSSLLGGTTARTAGSMWLPCSRIASARGIQDSPDKVRMYLRAVIGDRFDEQRVNAFLENAPRALDFLLEKSALRVFCPVIGSDYHTDVPGAVEVGRALYTEPFDGRLLGEYFHKLAAPPPVHTFMGIVPQLGRDVLHYARANRSATSAWYVGKRLFRQLCDRIAFQRGTRFTNGLALAGRLVKSAVDLGVPLWTSSRVASLLSHDGAVRGAVVETEHGTITVRVRRGVVLACGGFSHDKLLRETYLPPALSGRDQWTATAPGATGDGMRLGQSVGAAVNDNMSSPAAWSPMTAVPTSDGNVDVLPMFAGRGVPGVIAVTRSGRRFVNEADAYHDFGLALLATIEPVVESGGFLVCDSVALRRYGLGYVRPFPIPHGRHIRSGYLMRGRTIAELAHVMGIDAQALDGTVRAVNRDARNGVDTDFGKGTTAYNRRMGDDLHKPNPCIAPLEQPPFYAVKIVVGDIGTYVGLATDGRARVLDGHGRAITGLYAVGNDMAAIFGGSDPAGGTMLGPAVTFGFVAGRELAEAR